MSRLLKRKCVKSMQGNNKNPLMHANIMPKKRASLFTFAGTTTTTSRRALQQTLCCLILMRGNAIMQWSRTFTLELMMSFPWLSACFPSLPPSLPGNWKIEEVRLIALSREADLSLSAMPLKGRERGMEQQRFVTGRRYATYTHQCYPGPVNRNSTAMFTG